MEVFWTTINNINAGGWPLGKIVTVVIILVVTQILRVFLTATVIKRLEHWTSKTESEFDDELIAIKSRLV